MTTFSYKSRLRVSTRDLESARAGLKTCTIRAGNPRILQDELDLTDGSSSTRIRVVDVERKPFGSLGQRETSGEGFSTLDELKNDLRNYYPSLSPESPVTIIWFELVSTHS